MQRQDEINKSGGTAETVRVKGGRKRHSQARVRACANLRSGGGLQTVHLDRFRPRNLLPLTSAGVLRTDRGGLGVFKKFSENF